MSIAKVQAWAAVLWLLWSAGVGAQSVNGTAASSAPRPAKSASAVSGAAERNTQHKSKASPSAVPASRVVHDEKSGFSYVIEPAPAWVVPASERADVTLPHAPLHYRVIDEQIRVDEHDAADYSHVVRVVDDAAGLSVAAQIDLDFDPTYQTLALHHLDVVRDGVHSARLGHQRIQLLQRETQLEKRMVDGRVTMNITVDDVRAGDQIDFAYTVRGVNPIFGGRFVDQSWLASGRGPVALYQLRLLAPSMRDIHYRVGPTDVQTRSRQLGSDRETVFRREAVPQFSTEPGAPFEAVLAQQVQFSEFADWREVVAWGSELFQHGGVQALADAKADEWQAASADAGTRAIAGLNFVQQDIRYFGTETGINSHRPVAPDKVMAQRFGDCKDKVSLLLSMLKHLDIPATPVLVSAFAHRELAQMLPSPLAFNHVIARVQLAGQTYWLDATRNHQSGPLAQRQSHGFAYGLVLDGQGGELARLPDAFDDLRFSVVDTIHFEHFDQAPTLESRITYRGELAEAYREVLATRTQSEIDAGLAEPYVKAYPKIASEGPVQVVQSNTDNALTFVQHFRIPEFWRFPEQRVLVGNVVQWGAAQPLILPKTQTRHDAFAFSLPGTYRHTVAIDVPEDAFRADTQQHFDDGQNGITVRNSFSTGRRTVDAVAETRVGTDRIEAADWRTVTAKLDTFLSKLVNYVAVPAVNSDQLAALGSRLKSLSEDVRSHRIKFSTPLQGEAVIKAAVLSAQIDGGRLPPALLAQALKDRGVQWDIQGKPDQGQPDFDRARSLAPDSNDIAADSAVNAMAMQQFDHAIELANGVLTRDARHAHALDVRARARYLLGNLEGARTDLTQLLVSDPGAVRRGYPVVTLSLILRQQGQNPATLKEAYPLSQAPKDWPRPLVEFAVGDLDADAVLRAAKAEKQSAQALCEVYYYLGEVARAAGNQSRADELWHKVVDLGIHEYVEDGAARFRLAQVH